MTVETSMPWVCLRCCISGREIFWERRVTLFASFSSDEASFRSGPDFPVSRFINPTRRIPFKPLRGLFVEEITLRGWV